MRKPTRLLHAARAACAVFAYRDVTRGDDDDRLTDLLTDLMHWARFSGFDFDAALDRARMHYEADA